MVLVVRVSDFEQVDQHWQRTHEVASTLAELDLLLAAEPTHTQALNLAGWLRVSRTGDDAVQFERGLGQLRRALELGTDHDPRIIANFVDALASKQRGTEAVPWCRTWCEAHPRVASGFNTLGWLVGVALGQPDEGLVALDRAVELEPWFGTARLNRARVLLALQRIDPADEDLRIAVRVGCFRPHEAWVRLGEIAAARGQLRRALGAFRRASEVDQRGEYSLRLHQVIQSICSVLLQQQRYFLHPADDSAFSQQLERPAKRGAIVPLRQLAARAQMLATQRPEVASACAGIARCAQALGLVPGDADHSFCAELAISTEAGRELGRDFLAVQLLLYDELLAREEPLPGARGQFETALNTRAWDEAFIALRRLEPEPRLAAGETLGDRLVLFGELELADQAYGVAVAAATEVASWSTSGGEGLAAMSEVHRLEARQHLAHQKEPS